MRFLRTVNINGVDFTPEMRFWINIKAINSDPFEWINPAEFNPDRFDPASPMYKRPDGTARNPLSYTPFSAGHRICIGKTFAEIVVSFSLPLVLYHLDFEFTDPVN